MLAKINTILSADYSADNQRVMEEVQAKMSIPIDACGCRFLSYSFDKQVKKNPNGPLLIFNTTKGARSMCDYMLFCMQGSDLYILLTELKLGNEQKLPQLKAGKCLAEYIVATINRLYNTNYAPQIRMIGIAQKNFILKGSTKVKPIEYDGAGYGLFQGNTFVLREFMH